MAYDLFVRRIYRAFLLLVVCFVAGAFLAPGELGEVPKQTPETKPTTSQASERPNVVFILTDDLDVRSVKRLPRIKKLLIEKGTSFDNAFVTNSVCCPSRSTILRGQYTHNHEVLTSFPPEGGFQKFQNLDRGSSTIATWLQSGGYRTVLLGKYLNGYCPRELCNVPQTYVPEGWNEWYAWASFQRKKLNSNGRLVEYPQEHPDDVLSKRATGFISRTGGLEQPFFMYLAPNAPHMPADPAPRHRKAFSGAKMPRTPSFDERDLDDKPAWVRRKSESGPGRMREANADYRQRLRLMLAVDEMVARIVRTLEETGELDNTYIVLTSDHGFRLGEHGLPFGKSTAYEEDIRVPLIVRGPGVPEGRTLDHMILNNDFAPTFAELAGEDAPNFVDGRSFAPLLAEDPPSSSNWRSAFLVEHWKGESYVPNYKALRTKDYTYVSYEDGERELYDLGKGPYELENVYDTVDSSLRQRLDSRLEELRDCTGKECRAAEDG